MKSDFIAALAISLLAGCAANPAYLQTQSTLDLCVDQLTQSQSGVHHDARAQELARRGEDCSGYRDSAQSLAARRRDDASTLRSGGM